MSSRHEDPRTALHHSSALCTCGEKARLSHPRSCPATTPSCPGRGSPRESACLPLVEILKGPPDSVASFADLHRLQHPRVAQLIEHHGLVKLVWHLQGGGGRERGMREMSQGAPHGCFSGRRTHTTVCTHQHTFTSIHIIRPLHIFTTQSHHHIYTHSPLTHTTIHTTIYTFTSTQTLTHHCTYLHLYTHSHHYTHTQHIHTHHYTQSVLEGRKDNTVQGH